MVSLVLMVSLTLILENEVKVHRSRKFNWSYLWHLSMRSAPKGLDRMVSGKNDLSFDLDIFFYKTSKIGLHKLAYFGNFSKYLFGFSPLSTANVKQR